MGYDRILVSDLEVMARAHNYRRWMYRRVAPFVGRRVLEIGAGIGNFTSLLLDRELVVATDSHPPCVEYMRDRLGALLKVPPSRLDISERPDLRLRDYDFDTIVCLNVLEHVEDDDGALARMFGLLAPGGRLALLGAAWQAPGLRAAAVALGLRATLDCPVDRKGLAVVALAWRK
jgi:2-polyprenyl-3-methyl-5-hydroxy-6-metoxy-1,4-benzoquinol methylase